MSRYKAVEDMLKQYRSIVSDLEICCSEFVDLEQQLKLHGANDIETADMVIEGLSMSASVITDMPKSVTNKFSSVTENAAMNYLRYLKASPLEIKAINAMLTEKAEQIHRYNKQIRLIDNILLCLTDTERFVIESVYIRGYNHRQTKELFNKAYPACYVDDKHTIKRYK